MKNDFLNAAQCIEAEHVPPQAWRNGGGQTRELLAWPNAENWQLRISRADIEKSGPFSAFPGIERWFAVLTGNGVVLHMPQKDHHLSAGQAPLQFDGGLAPGCTLVDGATQDLNLMARSGGALMQAVEPGVDWQNTHHMCGLYTVQAGTWTFGPYSMALGAHTLLWFTTALNITQRFDADPHAASATHSAYWLAYTPETSA